MKLKAFLFAVAVCLSAIASACHQSQAPSQVVSDIWYSIEKGDADAIRRLSTIKPEDNEEFSKRLLAEMSEEFKKKGGIKSVETEKEDVKGDKAEVKFKVTCGNGETHSGTTYRAE